MNEHTADWGFILLVILGVMILGYCLTEVHL
jgi:hypothetical protein